MPYSTRPTPGVVRLRVASCHNLKPPNTGSKCQRICLRCYCATSARSTPTALFVQQPAAPHAGPAARCAAAAAFWASASSAARAPPALRAHATATPACRCVSSRRPPPKAAALNADRLCSFEVCPAPTLAVAAAATAVAAAVAAPRVLSLASARQDTYRHYVRLQNRNPKLQIQTPPQQQVSFFTPNIPDALSLTNSVRDPPCPSSSRSPP